MTIPQFLRQNVNEPDFVIHRPLVERVRTEESVDDLVTAVWQRVETWGSAGRGMYWHPQLSVDVAPGADGRFNDLQTLLADSGLEVKEKQLTGPVANTPKSTKTR